MSRLDQQRSVLADMGIDVWLERPAAGESTGIADGALASAPGDVSPEWVMLEQQVAACQLCELAGTRTQTVFGLGDRQARLMLIGEAPGAEEDRQGQPFVGKAGKLLDAMLFSIGLSREQVYICNVLKCRPPNNRNPRAVEVDACSAYLSEQVRMVNPEVVLALGRFAAHSLLQTEDPVYKMRAAENVLPSTDIPVVVTYHPASLLRNAEQKAQSWEDLCKVNALLGTEVV